MSSSKEKKSFKRKREGIHNQDKLIVIKSSEKNGKPGVMSRDYCLYVQSHLFASALSAAITQLHLLSECNNKLRFMKTMGDMDTHLAMKFQVERKVEDKINRRELESDQYKLDKLFADRKFLADVLHNAFVDMVENRCFASLRATNMELVGTQLDRDNLIEEEARNKLARREMARQLRQQRNYIKTVIYDTNLTVEHLKCTVEDTETNSQTRSRYIENWERARTEQHDHKIFVTESVPTDNINYYQLRADQEQRIHSEVELLVNISINETLTKVEQWMNKFEKDMEEQDLKITRVKNTYKDALDKRIELEKTYANHETLMKNWIQFKDDRQKALEYRNKMINSAIIVQAWWRALLVRLQIGPYKPMKRGKKPAADKKKK